MRRHKVLGRTKREVLGSGAGLTAGHPQWHTEATAVMKLLVAQGVKTIVVGAPGDDARLKAATNYGATAVVDLGKKVLKSPIDEETGGEGVDVAFECAGVAASVEGCIASLRPMGQHIQVAICGREIPFPIDSIFYKQLRMSGSVCYTAKTWDRNDEDLCKRPDQPNRHDHRETSDL